MNKVIHAVVIVSALSLLPALDAAAQTAPPPPAAPRQTQPAPAPRPETPAWQNTEGLVGTGTLVGAKVRDRQGKDIGEIDQLMVDPKSGKIEHAVVGMGGLLGIGERKVVVAWSDLQMAADPKNRDRWVVTADQATLDRAPRYDRAAAAGDRPAGDRPATMGGDRPASPAASPGAPPRRDADTPKADAPKTDTQKKQ